MTANIPLIGWFYSGDYSTGSNLYSGTILFKYTTGSVIDLLTRKHSITQHNNSIILPVVSTQNAPTIGKY